MSVMNADLLPVIAICGLKNAGKTTLIEQIVPSLHGDGLSVAVIKHDVHGLQVDRPGKDSDRLFTAGADVVLRGPDQGFARWHDATDAGLESQIAWMLERHDVVLIEGHKSTAWPKIWLHRPHEGEIPEAASEIGLELEFDDHRLAPSLEFIRHRIDAAWRRRTSRGAVLVGGESRRMGRPKQLIVHDGRTLAERAVDALDPHVDEVFLAGDGAVAERAARLRRIHDAPGSAGPIAGLLGVLRWSPETTWVVAACDMPEIHSDAVAWLLEQRRPGVWAVLPRTRSGRPEPALAVYEPQVRHLVEAQAASGRWGPRHLADHPRVQCPRVPPELQNMWRNVNTPEQLEDSDRSDV